MAIVLTITGGCRRHVALVPPPPNATPEQRVEAYERLEATHKRLTFKGSTQVGTAVILRDGREVSWAADLLPVLPPNSESARYARASTSKRFWFWLATGLTVSTAGIVVGVTADSGDSRMYIGAGIAIGGFILATVGSFVEGARRNMAARRAFETYNDALAEGLNVCADDLLIVPCESLVPKLPDEPQ